MSYSDLRKGRVSETGRAYFVTTVTINREPIFRDIYCSRLLVQCMKKLHRERMLNSLSWVIMPDHLHWLFQLQHQSNLGYVMKRLKGSSARHISRYLARKGNIWQRAYYDRAIRDGEDITGIARYIVANPLRARLVERIGDYPHWDAVWL